MSKVGEILRKKRELEAKSLEDIATQTMIAKKYIASLEEGRYDIFPGEVYARGFLRNYANFLGFDEGEIADLVSQYELEWQEMHLKLHISTPEKIPPVSKTNWSFYIISILIMGIFGFLIFYFIKQKVSQHELINYSDPTKMLKEEDISRAEDIIVEAIKSAKEDKTVDIKPKDVELEAFASESVWLQAIIDGKSKREILLAPDQKIKWHAKKNIFLTIGNAGGIVFKLNDRYIGALGRKGEVKKILVTSEGVDTHEAIQKEEPAKLPTLSEGKGSTSSTLSGISSQTILTPTIENQPTTPTTTTSQ
ncbi:MAG: RodZ domain-containing protein [bacterium]